ncbi:MAG TPA: NAD-dependent protein deacetylase [Steroidobacteraceae bacterium]|jgi:NAD-dependent SIR2 family protein deacetylase|nr:NAD-dependent protein deacetylase [Steroidobacteraceae bacterium]
MSTPPAARPPRSALLGGFIESHPRLFVLTGAGCSTESGIPDYRDVDGNWKRSARPMTLQAFTGDESARRRYWARSLLGWPRIGAARPNEAHHALTRLQWQGRIEGLVTQNVDGLHQAAGSREVIDLHGRLDRVRCMGCERLSSRADLQHRLLQQNPQWTARLGDGAGELEPARHHPDGDAELPAAETASFAVPTCPECGGILKPDVVFFGESVPGARVEAAYEHLRRADAMLVVGSSLMLYSGYRFARFAAELGKPIAAINLGRTRADELLTLKVVRACSAALAFVVESPQRAA